MHASLRIKPNWHVRPRDVRVHGVAFQNNVRRKDVREFLIGFIGDLEQS
jgi:hypothetical protein